MGKHYLEPRQSMYGMPTDFGDELRDLCVDHFLDGKSSIEEIEDQLEYALSEIHAARAALLQARGEG